MEPTTKELLMRVIQVETPELFDGTDAEPAEIVDYEHHDYCPAICDTCGDEPENLSIEYRARDGLTNYVSYDGFGLSEVLEALDRWDACHKECSET